MGIFTFLENSFQLKGLRKQIAFFCVVQQELNFNKTLNIQCFPCVMSKMKVYKMLENHIFFPGVWSFSICYLQTFIRLLHFETTYQSLPSQTALVLVLTRAQPYWKSELFAQLHDSDPTSGSACCCSTRCATKQPNIHFCRGPCSVHIYCWHF